MNEDMRQQCRIQVDGSTALPSQDFQTSHIFIQYILFQKQVHTQARTQAHAHALTHTHAHAHSCTQAHLAAQTLI